MQPPVRPDLRLHLPLKLANRLNFASTFLAFYPEFNEHRQPQNGSIPLQRHTGRLPWDTTVLCRSNSRKAGNQPLEAVNN